MSKRIGKRVWSLAATLGVMAMLAALTAALLLPDSASAQPANPLKPSTPTLTATASATSPSEIMLSWTESSTKAGLAITGYEVQRRYGADPGFNALTTVSASATSHTDTGLMASTMYTYRVRANAGSFMSDWSAEMSATTMAASTNGGNGDMMDDVTVGGWSSSSNGGDTITITVTDGMRRDIDASFILVLEDDFVVPDSIPNGVVYFRQSEGDSGGARTYASVSIDSEDDSDDDDATYNVGDDSHTIQIYVPDMDPADATASGLGTTKYTIVIPKEAGIKNAGDSRDSKIGYQLVNSGGFVEGMTQMFGNDGSGDDKADSKVTTNPKVTLDDKNNKRGYELTISGTGFNKNSSATAYVLKGPAEPPAAAPSCATVIADGESIGSGTVGSDYKVTITTEVTGGGKGDFSPGETNYICIRDDNSPDRRVSASRQGVRAAAFHRGGAQRRCFR